MQWIFSRLLVLVLVFTWPLALRAQVPPSWEEISRYTGMLAPAARGDAVQIEALLAIGESPNIRDGYGRTPLHVAAYGGHHEAVRVLVATGADEPGGRLCPTQLIGQGCVLGMTRAGEVEVLLFIPASGKRGSILKTGQDGFSITDV